MEAAHRIPKTVRGLRGFLAEELIPLGAVARAYGCHWSYLSNVFRERYGVSPKTLDRIRAAIARALEEREAASVPGGGRDV